MMRDIAEVEWEDTATKSGWHKAGKCNIETVMIYTVGYVVEETDRSITISATWSADEGHAECTAIPKRSIVKDGIRYLQERSCTETAS